MLRHQIPIYLIVLVVAACGRQSPASSKQEDPSSITISGISNRTLEGYEWMNPPTSWGVEDGVLRVTTSKGTDFFNNPEDSSIVGSAPFLYEEVSGDFVFKALVRPEMTSQWNAVSAMVYIDSLHWIKFAFENSDATGPSIVSVVTRGVSDDANGAVLDAESAAWLAIARKGNIYSMHWSRDGVEYAMARLASMPNHENVKVGVEAQCPVGETATHEVLSLDLSRVTVENPRSLN